MKKIKNNEELFKLIAETGDQNTLVSEESKQLKERKEEIKTYMIDNKIEKAEGGGYAVTAYTSEKPSMNDVKVMEIINGLMDKCDEEELFEKLAGAIEYKPTLNEDKLEDLLYHGVITEKDLQPAMSTKVTVGLRFGKASNGKKK